MNSDEEVPLWLMLFIAVALALFVAFLSDPSYGPKIVMAFMDTPPQPVSMQ